MKHLKLYSFSILLYVSLINKVESSESFLDKVGKNLMKEIDKICLINDNCNTNFFNLKNYCCGVKCCDWFSYVFSNE